MSQLVRLRGKDTVQTAHCALLIVIITVIIIIIINVIVIIISWVALERSVERQQIPILEVNFTCVYFSILKSLGFVSKTCKVKA